MTARTFRAVGCLVILATAALIFKSLTLALELVGMMAGGVR